MKSVAASPRPRRHAKTRWGRWIVEGLMAWAVSLGVQRYLLPLPVDDFHSTLRCLPWIVLGLIWVERWGRARGGRRLAPSVVVGEGLAVVLLAILTARRAELGLVGLEAFLAPAWFLLLAQRVARQVIALRPCLGFSLPRRPSLVFAFLPLVVYLALQPWMGQQRGLDGDEPYYLLLAHSVAYDADVDLTNNYVDDWRHFSDRALEPQPGDPVGDDGELHSRHSALLPLVLASVYRGFGLAGVRGFMALVGALLAWMILRLAYRYRPQAPTMGLWLWALVAFGPPLVIYSYQVWAEIPAALLLAVALDRVQQIRSTRGRETAPSWDSKQLALLLLPMVLLPWLKLRFGLISLGILVLAVGRGRPDRRSALRLGALLGAMFAGLLIYNTWRFGHPLRMHQWSELSLGTAGLSTGWRGALGLFYDSAFGLFAVAPIWLLLLPALVRCWQTQRALLTDVAILAGPYLVLLWPRSEWYGGWSPAFRYGLVFLPVLAMLLLPLDGDRRRIGLRWSATFLGLGTLFLLTIWVVKPGWTYNFADGGTLLLHHVGRFLSADVCRFFPSMVRPRTASWVWPLASLLWIPLCLWGGRSRRSRGLGITTAAAATLLVSLLLLVALALHWPTTTVEVEDGYVDRQLGVPYPPLWSLRRADYRGGWHVVSGGQLSAPINDGGQRVELIVHATAVGRQGSYALEVAADDTTLATLDVEVGTWQRFELPTVPWPAAARLVLRTPESAERGGGVVVDRVDLRWR